MAKRILVSFLILSLVLSLSGCFLPVMVIPDSKSIGEAKTFTKDGIQLTLTDKFTETPSQRGFYAYYTSDFCGVVVLKEEFSLQEGLADEPLHDYVANVIKNNGHKGIQPQSKDGLWFYVKDGGDRQVYSYSFKGSDAFWIVQYICRTSDVAFFEDQFFLWAKCVEVR